MSILTDLEAALEAKQEAWAAFTAYTHGADQQALLDEYDIACGRYEALLTDDTVAALVAVARAVQRVRVEPRWCDSRLEDDYACEDCDGCDAEADYDRFRDALAAYRKERGL